LGLERTAVAIVGGGPVGLLLAAELGVRGVRTIVLGDSPGTSTHPKANTHGARSMEIYRRHGVAAALRAGSPSKEHRTDVAYYTRLLGHELHRVSLPAPRESIEETLEPQTRWPTPEPHFARANWFSNRCCSTVRASSQPSTFVTGTACLS